MLKAELRSTYAIYETVSMHRAGRQPFSETIYNYYVLSQMLPHCRNMI